MFTIDENRVSDDATAMRKMGNNAECADNNDAAADAEAVMQTTGNNAYDDYAAADVDAAKQTMEDRLRRRQHCREADKAEDRRQRILRRRNADNGQQSRCQHRSHRR
jgi:hypothetical protein